jgi:ferritin-like protein
LVLPRVSELGGALPNDIRDFADRALCPDAGVSTSMDDKGGFDVEDLAVEDILDVLLGAERCAIRIWSEICDMTRDADPRTYDMARILNDRSTTSPGLSNC